MIRLKVTNYIDKFILKCTNNNINLYNVKKTKDYILVDIKDESIDEVKRIVTDCLHKVGHLGSINEFKEFCSKYGITKISDRYYSDFINKFDPKLFCE